MRAASVHDIAAIVRGRRLDLGLSQAALAARVGVSRKWLSGLENGKAAAELGLVLRTLDALGLEADIATPSRPPSTTGDIDLDAIIARHRRDA